MPSPWDLEQDKGYFLSREIKQQEKIEALILEGKEVNNHIYKKF